MLFLTLYSQLSHTKELFDYVCYKYYVHIYVCISESRGFYKQVICACSATAKIRFHKQGPFLLRLL